MVSFIPPPDPRSLLPPLLACLPAAFASTRPPPALLPLLSPILRQRVHLLSGSQDSSASESWLTLLCWNSELAAELQRTLSESDAFELHPVSGEIDYGDLTPTTFRRLDEETLQTRMELRDLGITVVHLWCENNDVDGGSGWKVAEVRPFKEGTGDGMSPWVPTISQANEMAKQKAVSDAIRQGQRIPVGLEVNDVTFELEEDQEGDDEDYWALYDATPGPRASQAQPSPRPSGRLERNASESEYFARYETVQPEMDNDDPNEDRAQVGESILDGNALSSLRPAQTSTHEAQPVGASNTDHRSAGGLAMLNAINHPAAIPNMLDGAALERLEASADMQSTSEVAIKQHVSYTIKSLFRLCHNAGMEPEEFDRLVRTELDVLSMISDSES